MDPFKLRNPASNKKRQPLSKQMVTATGTNNLQDNDEDDPNFVAVTVSPLRSPRKRGHEKNGMTGAQQIFINANKSESTHYLPVAAIVAGPVMDVYNDEGLEMQQKGIVQAKAYELDVQANGSMTTSLRGKSDVSSSCSSPSSSAAASAYLALSLIAFSAFIYSLQTLNVKLLGEHFDSFTATFFRGMVGTFLCLLHHVYTTQTTTINQEGNKHFLLGKAENRRLLALRGMLGGLTIASAFYAVTALDLAEASVIIFTAPLWTAVFSKVLGISEWAKVDTLSAFCCIIGMILVTKPPFFFDDKAKNDRSFSLLLPGLCAALLSATTAAGVNITISKLKGEESSTITLYAMLGSVVVALPGFYYHQLGPQGHGMLWTSSTQAIAQLCLTGFLSWLAQMSKTTGLKLSKTMGVLVMRYLDIIFCYFWDCLFLHVAADPISTWGSMIIIGGCLASVLSKRKG